MSAESLPSTTDQTSTDVTGPYVVEHYGFSGDSGPAAGDLPHARTASAPRRNAGGVPRPAGNRGRRLLTAAALGLVLTGGIGGVAAAADQGADGRGDGGRGGFSVVDDRGGNLPPAGFNGPAGRR